MLTMDKSAPKRAANLSFNSDLLRQARALGINLSARLEPELMRIVAEEQKKQLDRELAPAIAAWGEYYATHDAVADEYLEDPEK